MNTQIEFRKERLKKFIDVLPKVFGGPGSGPNKGGGGGSDDGTDDIGKIAKIPKAERTLKQMEIILKPMNVDVLKGIVSKTNSVIKNPKTTNEDRQVAVRENTAAQNVLVVKQKKKS